MDTTANGHLVADPVEFKVCRSDGTLVLEADLVDLYVLILECGADAQFEHEVIRKFRDELSKRGSRDHVLALSSSQAEAIYHAVNERYAAFKKKLQPPPMLRASSVSIPELSIAE